MAIPVYLWLTDYAGNQVKGSVDIRGREGSIDIFHITMMDVRVNGIEPLMFDIKNATFKRRNHLEAFHSAYEKITWHYLDGNIIHSDNWDAKQEATV